MILNAQTEHGKVDMQRNAQKVQTRLANPRTPAQRAADIVEHVIATGGENYLETRHSKLHWWQLALLDVKLVLGLGVLLLLGCVGLAMYCVIKLLANTLFGAKQGGRNKATQVQKHKDV